METIVTEKQCKVCGQLKPIDDYYRHKKYADGYHSKCKVCHNKQVKDFYKKHPERQKENQARWEAKNMDKVRARKRRFQAKYRLQNLEKVRSAIRLWTVKNYEKVKKAALDWAHNNHERRKEIVKISQLKRRAQKMQSGGTITAKEWKDLCERHQNKCLCCGADGVKLTLDHVVPLSRGGSNTIGNAQPLCQSCNSKKGTKTIDYR